jgi:hypothetical protein
MTWDAAGLRKLDGVISALVAGIASFVLMAAAFGGFTIVLESYRAPAGIVCW